MQASSIVFDRNGASGPGRPSPFWLRVQEDALTVGAVELGAHSLPEAYRKALALGHDPSTWISDGRESAIPGGLDHMRVTARADGLIP